MEVTEKAATVAALPAPYGCHNRPPLGRTRVVQQGLMPMRDGYGNPCPVPIYIDIPHRMSTECQHPSANDPRCAGCNWRRTNA